MKITEDVIDEKKIICLGGGYIKLVKSCRKRGDGEKLGGLTVSK